MARLHCLPSATLDYIFIETDLLRHGERTIWPQRQFTTSPSTTCEVNMPGQQLVLKLYNALATSPQ
jgi:hypothetical protein